MSFPFRASGPMWKGAPAPALKAEKAKDDEKERTRIKKLVWARDKGKCRVCGGKAEEMHELKFRSLGGKRSSENSIAVCVFTGRNCHRLLQTLAIDVEGTNANTRLIFRWNMSRFKDAKVPFRIPTRRKREAA